MADTSFVDNVITAANRIVSTWLNAVNKHVYQGVNPSYVTSTGSANAQVITLPSSLLAALVAGQTFTWKAGFTSTTTTPTLTVVGTSSIGPYTIKTKNNEALHVGAIVANGICVTLFDGTSMLLLNSELSFFANGAGPATQPTAAGSNAVAAGNDAIASGAGAVALGGSSVTASGSLSSAVGGSLNQATGTRSGCFAGSAAVTAGSAAISLGGIGHKAAAAYSTTVGEQAFAYRKSQLTLGSGTVGQYGIFPAFVTTTSATPALAVVVDDGSVSQSPVVASNTTIGFVIEVTARRTDVAGEAAMYTFTGLVANNAGTTALIGSVTKVVVAESAAAWDCGVTANNSTDTLDITCTGEAAKTINWCATCRFTELGLT